MEENGNSLNPLNQEALPFPLDWIKSDPRKIESILSEMTLEEQARCLQLVSGRFKMALLVLSPQAIQLARSLPEEEVYQMIKDVGEEDSIPVLAVITQTQLQYIFDLEWWNADKFNPKNAIHWLDLMNQANDQSIFKWFLTEDFDQKVMLLQALIIVKKLDDEPDLTSEYEKQSHFSPDGVHQIFFKVEDVEPILKKVFKILFSETPKLFFALMDAVIWYQVTPTVETAYRWLLSRTEEKGIPSYDEAMEVYSLLKPEAFKVEVPKNEDFIALHSNCLVPPSYPFEDINSSSFFGQCLNKLNGIQRLDAICWELVYLSNKVMVADRLDLSVLENRHNTMRKVLGYINIGLELGAGGDVEKGHKLLTQTWMQSLFQMGHTGIMRLKWEGEKLIRENGQLLEYVLPAWAMEHLAALVGRFPKMAVTFSNEEDATEVSWRNLESINDIQILENFIFQSRFYIRFARQSFDLSLEKIDGFVKEVKFPTSKDDFDMIHFFTTALARFTLLNEISCEPILEEGGRAFLQAIFQHNWDKQDIRIVDSGIVEKFCEKLLTTSLAWTDSDLGHLNQLANQSIQNLQVHFGRLDFNSKIDWQFTRGLLLK